ncbi:hypothetical protein CMQ_5800 [Grosmannia clavigera kw1407]|uniref:MARVEL domain-containing protein n=1 Tax=Grosmannia clavigera (strain kw1407 / UAMH 11150) TaxID=655863 RepID=F0XT22_GROCL|nr:uncharacterized protein CMQ_5800 [Grosmannia clavigera kw1407]EFW99379.1 hypothetical protein CMQ_5800 [Grosmannia clavigera kw1407]
MASVFGFGADSGARTVGREHFPVYPRGFFGLRIAQLVLALIVLGLDAYGLYSLSFSGDGLNMFTCIATVITCVYLLVAELAVSAIFNYWAALGLDIFLVVFWLVSFALMASQVAPFMRTYDECYGDYCYTYALDGYAKTFADCMAAVAGLGGLEFLLFIVSLAISGFALHRHRALGLHCIPGQERTVVGAGEKGVPVALQSIQPAQSFQQQPAQPQLQPQTQPQQFQAPAAAYSQTFTPPPPSSTPGAVSPQATYSGVAPNTTYYEAQA